MNRFESFKPAVWAMAALTVAVLAGCGGGGDSAPATPPPGNNNPPPQAGPNVCTAGAANCVDLGTSAKYAILTPNKITSGGTSAITGDTGLSTGSKSSYVGFTLTPSTDTTFSTDPQVTGKIFAADDSSPTPVDLAQAQIDAANAYTAAGNLTPTLTTGAGAIDTADCAGATPGVYHFTGALSVNSACTFNGGPDDIWVFQVDGALTQNANVALTGGAQAKNVFWRVNGAVTVGAGLHSEGVVLSTGSITLGTGATSTGRLLAGNEVTIDGSTVAQP